jgi:hypothetical protein
MGIPVAVAVSLTYWLIKWAGHSYLFIFWLVKTLQHIYNWRFQNQSIILFEFMTDFFALCLCLVRPEQTSRDGDLESND